MPSLPPFFLSPKIADTNPSALEVHHRVVRRPPRPSLGGRQCIARRMASRRRRAGFMMLLSLLQRTGAFSNCRQGGRRHVHHHINSIRLLSSLPLASNDDQSSVGEAMQLSELQPILIRNCISANELNESCLRALSSCPPPMANGALKAYTIQKRRRETNGTEKISNPSSYIMAVLR